MFKVDHMPVLRPVSAFTKGKNWLTVLWYWITFIRRFELVEDWYFSFNGQDFKIPKGFISDGASVPRTYWWIFSPVGVLFLPGIIHDYLYTTTRFLQADGTYGEELSRKQVDKIFKDLSNDINGLEVINFGLYLIIRVVGWIPWMLDRRRK
jgi:hypothetical protein